MTDKVQKIISNLKDVIDDLGVTSPHRLPIIEAIECLQEEPVSEKKCMFTKNNYTNEDRKVLCENCKEKCEYSKKEEPVSEDLKEAAQKYADLRMSNYGIAFYAFMSGAKWQKEHLWKSADGDDLPEIGREVIALLDNGKVVFAHRPNPEGLDGKSLTSGKVVHYTPKTYDKGGWNIPDIVYWLDVELPKEIEP